MRLHVVKVFPALVYALASVSVMATERPRNGVHWGAYPIFNYTSDLGLMTGILARRFDYGPGVRPFSNLTTLQASYATRGPKDIFFEYETTEIGAAAFRLRSSLYYAENNYQRYYGLGPDSKNIPSLAEQGYYYYRSETAIAELEARNAIGKGWDLFAGFSGYFSSTDSDQANSQYAMDYGASRASTYSTLLKFGIVYEARDSEFIPSEGQYLESRIAYSPHVLSRADDWSRFEFDYRRYDAFVGERWLSLASQLRYAATTSETPLVQKARLGSLGTLRGFPLNRFVSNHSVSLREEMRSVWLRTGLFGLPLKGGTGVFVEGGKISDRLASLPKQKTHLAAGFTLFGSYFTDDFLGSADFGFSEEGASLYLRLGHAF